ncbi:MAG: class III signal peptide-containing protein [Candidatus Micrarchaeota archaeon]|jgi:hypothetical protein
MLGDVVKGQLSAEMLILITVVLAIVAIAAYQLLNTAKESAAKINQSASYTLDNTQPCSVAGDCRCSQGKIAACEFGVCKCT